MTSLFICRIALAFIWIYQGVVPKWLGPHADELIMNMAAGFDPDQAVLVAFFGGAMEVLLGLAVLVFYQRRWPYMVSAAGITALYLFTVLYADQFLVSAFNSTTVNVAVCALSLVALVEVGSENKGR